MAQLITADEVISICFTNKNTDAFLVGDHFIEIAQEEYIRPALAFGELRATESLYQTIVDQNNAGTLTTANAALLVYIKPCLAFYVKAELINDMVMQTSSQGIQTPTPEGSSSATDTQRSDIKTQAIKHAETYRDKMIRFIEDVDNIDDYPLYNTGNNASSTVSVKGGIIMGTSSPLTDRG